MSKCELSTGFIAATGLPARVIAGQTTRQPLNCDFASAAPFDGFNLALHVGDDARTVQQQRIKLLKALEPYGAKRLVWLEQTHSTQVYQVTEQVEFLPVNADALVTRQTGVACMIMTADCLPIVLTTANGDEVACIHAGWRGLLNGIIENTVSSMTEKPVYGWFGAAIGTDSFEVGSEVFDAFVQQDTAAQAAFQAKEQGKYLADLYQLARLRLQKLGIEQMSGGEHCSYQQASQFYSYRRTAKTGRMATFVMIL